MKQQLFGIMIGMMIVMSIFGGMIGTVDAGNVENEIQQKPIIETNEDIKSVIINCSIDGYIKRQFIGFETVFNTSTNMVVGSSFGIIEDTVRRSFISFDTSILQTKFIISAKLNVYLESKNGGNTINRYVRLYNVNFGETLDTTDFNPPVYYTESNSWINIDTAPIGQWYNRSLNIDYLNTTRVQYKLQLSDEEVTSIQNFCFANFTTKDHANIELQPFLEITYIDQVISDAENDINQPILGIINFDGSNSLGHINNYTWNFTYDGGLVELYGPTTSYDFQIYGVYQVNLTVTNSTYGWNDTDTMTVTIYSIPIAVADGPHFVYTNSSFELNATLSTDNITISNYTWLINGNYYYDNVTTVDTTSYSAGTYPISLKVTNDMGYSGWDNTSYVKIQDWPIADAGIDQTVEIEEWVYFDGSGSTGELTNYTWNFTYDGGLIELYELNPQYMFNITGNYLVNLTVTDGNYTHTDNMNLTITGPVIDAGGNDTTNRGFYQFDGTGTSPSIINYTWNFTYDGNPVSIYGQTPQFNFTIVDTYNITLYGRTAGGWVGNDTMFLTIVNTPPIADAGPNQNDFIGIYTFDGSGSYDPDWGIIDNYTWIFTYDGNPVELYGVSPSYDFQIAGMYIITLNVTDNDGDSDTDTVIITAGWFWPVADAGVDRIGKGIMDFDGSASTKIGGTIVNWTWTFIYDGIVTQRWGELTYFNFNISGVYLIELNVTCNHGLWDTDFTNYTVIFPIPTAIITPETQSGLRGEYKYHGLYSTANIIHYQWEFTYNGTAIVQTGSRQSFTFWTLGDYEITLTVTNSDWRTNSTTGWINVSGMPPVADFTYWPFDDNKGMKIINSTSTDIDGWIVNYTWQFEYNSIVYNYYTESFQFEFLLEGNFSITLNVTDNDGFTNETTQILSIVWKYPVANAGISLQYAQSWTVKTFNGSKSTDEDGYIVNYTWTFTYDGTNYTYWGESFQHKFDSQDETFNLTLTVTDDDGLTNSTAVSVMVINPITSAHNILIWVLPLAIVLMVIIWIFRRQLKDFLHW